MFDGLELFDFINLTKLLGFAGTEIRGSKVDFFVKAPEDTNGAMADDEVKF